MFILQKKKVKGIRENRQRVDGLYKHNERGQGQKFVESCNKSTKCK